jgi:hypothetical protein
MDGLETRHVPDEIRSKNFPNTDVGQRAKRNTVLFHALMLSVPNTAHSVLTDLVKGNNSGAHHYAVLLWKPRPEGCKVSSGSNPTALAQAQVHTPVRTSGHGGYGERPPLFAFGVAVVQSV